MSDPAGQPVYPALSPKARLLKLALLLCLGVLALVALSRLLYPFDSGLYESCTWMPARLIASGTNPYAFALRPPFVYAPYGPFFYTLLAAGSALAGDQFWFGRGLAILAEAGCAAAVFALARRYCANPRLPWAAALLFPLQIPVQLTVALERPDFVAVAFGLAAVAAAVTDPASEDRPGRRHLLVLALVLAAYFSKQTTLLPGPVVVALYFLRGRPKGALALAAGVAAAAAVVVVLLNRTSEGGYVFQHYVASRGVPRTLSGSLQSLRSVLLSPGTLLFLGLGAAALLRRRESSDDPCRGRELWVLGTYAAGAAGIAFVTSGFAGANINYWIETEALLCVLGAVAAGRLSDLRAAPRRILEGLLVLGLLFAALNLARSLNGERHRWASRPYFEELVQAAAAACPPDRPGYSMYPELLVRAGRRYEFNDVGAYFDRRSEVLTGALEEHLSSGAYPVLLLTDPAPRPGYTRYAPRTPEPAGVFVVHLFVRDGSRSPAPGSGPAVAR